MLKRSHRAAPLGIHRVGDAPARHPRNVAGKSRQNDSRSADQIPARRFPKLRPLSAFLSHPGASEGQAGAPTGGQGCAAMPQTAPYCSHSVQDGLEGPSERYGLVSDVR